MAEYKRLGIIGRFKPLHLGHEQLLRGMLAKADTIVVGIGSENQYDANNPLTARETLETIRATFEPEARRVHICYIRDFWHLPQYNGTTRWRDEVVKQFGTLDGLVTGNAWTAREISTAYRIIPLGGIIPAHELISVSSTEVRKRIAEGTDWDSLVPKAVAQYLRANFLDQRIREEFGSEIIRAGKVEATQ